MNQVSNPGNVQLLQQLPNSTAALVLGIISIAMCWCYGIVGIVLGIIGLVMGNKAVSLYRQSPGVYAEASYKNANAGKICSIIGLVLGVLTIVFVIIYIVILGATFGSLNNFMDILNQ